MMDDGKISVDRGDVLVVVDAQNDFVNDDGALAVVGLYTEPTVQQIIDRIGTLKRLLFGWIVTTEDRHPSDGHIEYDIFGGKHCEENTVGQEYHEDLISMYKRANDNVVKGQCQALISYTVATSPYFHGHIRKMRARKFKRIFLTGWAYTHCVGESAIDYARQGFEVYVVRDATRSVPPPYGDPEVMAQKLKLYGVKEVNADQLVV